MKSYKCEYCNLTNWTDVVVCKRCQMPNPYLPDHEGINDNQFAQEPIQQYAQEPMQGYQQQPQYAQQNHQDMNQTYQDQPFQNNLNQSDPSLPPPPNVYGQRAGNTSYADGYGQNQMYQGGGHQQVIPNDVDIRFTEALGNINSAFKAGKVYCIICAVFFVLLGVLFLFAASAASNSQGGAEAGGILALTGVILFVTLAIIIGIVYGLSYGVKKKSRACAIILVVLFGLGLLINLLGLLAGGGATQNGVSILVGILWTYYFSLGIKGTFAYHEIVEQYPTLKEQTYS